MPSRSIEPESGSCKVATVRMSELLPAPFGPNRPNMRLPMVSERFFSAFTPFGYVLDKPVIVSAKPTTSDFAISQITCYVLQRVEVPELSDDTSRGLRRLLQTPVRPSIRAIHLRNASRTLARQARIADADADADHLAAAFAPHPAR